MQMPGHSNVAGIVEADRLVHQGSTHTMLRLKPALEIQPFSDKSALRDGIARRGGMELLEQFELPLALLKSPALLE